MQGGDFYVSLPLSLRFRNICCLSERTKPVQHGLSNCPCFFFFYSDRTCLFSRSNLPKIKVYHARKGCVITGFPLACNVQYRLMAEGAYSACEIDGLVPGVGITWAAARGVLPVLTVVSVSVSLAGGTTKNTAGATTISETTI